MPMYNLIEYCNIYSKTFGSVWQYYREDPVFNNDGNVIDFPTDNNSTLFLFK